MVNRYVGAGKFFGEKVVKPTLTAIKKTFRSTTIRLEGRGSFNNSQFARSNFGLGSRIGRSRSNGQSKIVLRDVFAAPVMVY